jgi:hypothetical protein
VGILGRVVRWWAIRQYRSTLAYMLVKRYGARRSYTPPQVLTTIKVHGLNARYAAHACAMFCTERAYNEFVAKHVKGGSAAEQFSPLWIGAGDYDDAWIPHAEIVSEVPYHPPESASYDSGGDGFGHVGYASDDYGGGPGDSGSSDDGSSSN